MAKLLKDLIEDITQDDLPTNEFTIEDEDPMVILGKLNEVISKLTEIRDLIGDSDSKANEALTAALEALTNSQEALSGVNIAVDTSNAAITTANDAIASANEALSQATAAFNAATQAGTDATGALEAANQAKQDATNASISANDANDKADIAITDSSNALAFASSADSKADGAVTTADGANTKADGAVTASNEAKSKAEDANNTANSANDYAINADSNAADAKRIAQEALDKVVEGTGTTIIDYSGNKLKNAKFKGSTSINVDMSEIDPHEFEFRVDATILNDIASKASNANLIAVNEKTTANSEAIDTINATLPNKANVNYVDDALSQKANTQYVNTELAKKVNTEQGKGLSSNDFTDALLTKLTNIYSDLYPLNSAKIFLDDLDHSKYLGLTWTKKSSGYALWTSSSGAGGTIEAGLPNITGSADCYGDGYFAYVNNNGALEYVRSGQRNSSTGNESKGVRITLDASKSNAIYGKSSTVQPPAIKIALWVRTA